MEPLQNYFEDLVKPHGIQLIGPLDPATGQNIDANILTRPSEYLSKYVRVSARKDKIDQPFAAATVLQVLRLNRETYAVRTPTKDRSTEYIGANSMGRYGMVGEPGGTETNCVQNPAAHWSDIALHYYCTLPYVARACYTTLIRNFTQNTSSGVPLDKQRQIALKMCLNTGGDSGTDPNYANGLQYKKQFQHAYEQNWVVDKTTGKKVNVFNYLMLSQTYAFNWEQQQAVLNTFYGDMKKGGSAGPAVFNPSDNAECFSFRPKREIETSGNNYCSRDKVLNQPMAAAGR